MALTYRFDQAVAYTAHIHGAQRRKGTEVPYLAHLLAVAALALEHGADEEEAIAALLHDAVEDQGGVARAEDIRARFGDRVAEIVLGCSDTSTTPKPPWHERKRAYIAHLPAASPSALLVSVADKLHNARSILLGYRLQGDEVWTRFTGTRDDILWYYHSLIDAFRASGDTRITTLVDELERIVGEITRLVEG